MFDIWMLFVILLAIVAIVLFAAGAYTVVPPHEAHVVVSRGRGRKLFCSRKGFKSSYFSVPIFQKRTILPLRNKQLEIDDIPLRDRDIAKFMCDVVCWINITDPIMAAERIGEQKRARDFTGIQDDITVLVKSVTRNSSMKMDIVSLMSEREKFSQIVEEEIKEQIRGWGITMVDLECVHFHDQEPYHVISDLEKRQAKVIETTTRKKVADKEKEASIVESNATKETEIVKADNEKLFKTKQIQRDEELGKLEQAKEKAIETERQEANKQKVEAKRTLDVGEADVAKQAKIKTAEGDAEANRTTGKAKADVVEMEGTAEATVIQKKAFAEASGIDRKAEAQKKYNQAGAMAIEIITTTIQAAKDIEIAKYNNLGQALQKANVSVVSTGEKEILGIPVGAEAGIALGGMFKSLKDAGFDVEGILRDVASAAKEILSGKMGGKEKRK